MWDCIEVFLPLTEELRSWAPEHLEQKRKSGGGVEPKPSLEGWVPEHCWENKEEEVGLNQSHHPYNQVAEHLSHHIKQAEPKPSFPLGDWSRHSLSWLSEVPPCNLVLKWWHVPVGQSYRCESWPTWRWDNQHSGQMCILGSHIHLRCCNVTGSGRDGHWPARNLGLQPLVVITFAKWCK